MTHLSLFYNPNNQTIGITFKNHANDTSINDFNKEVEKIQLAATEVKARKLNVEASKLEATSNAESNEETIKIIIKLSKNPLEIDVTTFIIQHILVNLTKYKITELLEPFGIEPEEPIKNMDNIFSLDESKLEGIYMDLIFRCDFSALLKDIGESILTIDTKASDIENVFKQRKEKRIKKQNGTKNSDSAENNPQTSSTKIISTLNTTRPKEQEKTKNSDSVENNPQKLSSSKIRAEMEDLYQKFIEIKEKENLTDNETWEHFEKIKPILNRTNYNNIEEFEYDKKDLKNYLKGIKKDAIETSQTPTLK